MSDGLGWDCEDVHACKLRSQAAGTLIKSQPGGIWDLHILRLLVGKINRLCPPECKFSFTRSSPSIGCFTSVQHVW